MTSMVDTLILNGRPFSSVYDATALKFTDTTPEGRVTTSFIDTQEKLTKFQVSGILDRDFGYDNRGRLITITQGVGVDQRVTTINYNSQGFVDSFVDAELRSTRFEYDLAGRVTKQILPDLREINFLYDANGNITSITPPGKPSHSFTHTSVNLENSYDPPNIGLTQHATQLQYNLDKQLTQIIRPDGKTIAINYDSGGRLDNMVFPRGTLDYGYDPGTGNLNSIIAPDGAILNFTYDGFLQTGTSWGGPAGSVSGNVTQTFDNSFRVTSRSVNGGNTINFVYDNDDLVTSAGAQTLSYDSQNGLISGTTLGVVNDSYSFSGFGEISNYTANSNGSTVFQTQFIRDKIGRITQKVETVQGVVSTFDYFYDASGRLISVNKNGLSHETFTYDSNGNRTNNSATYDDQDRLNSTATSSYTYTDNGELLSKTDNVGTTSYEYDALGNLMKVTLPSGNFIDYLVDGKNRRVGKKVDGTLEKVWLYQGNLSPIAQLDAAGNVVARFVYASKGNVPDYMIKSGITYRIISDHLGSPRLVIDTSTGLPAQIMEYDSFGNVISDTNPEFQPFGFGGGLYDPDTKLVRFGARDYDAETGRWTAKDPIRFAGSDTNLYGYALNDPINSLDPTGLTAEEDLEALIGLLEFAQQLDDLGNIIIAFDLATLPSGEGLAGIASKICGKGLRLVAEKQTVSLIKSNVKNAKLKRIVGKLFQDKDKVPGGTAGAIKYERETGELLSATGHIQAGRNRARGLEKLLKGGKLNAFDRSVAKFLKRQLDRELKK